MAENHMIGGFDAGRLAGVVAVGQPTFVKGRHKAVVHGLYIRDGDWSTDLPDTLMNGMLHDLDPDIECLYARVSAEDNDALMLFRRHGFSTVGTEPRALKLEDGRYVDHYLMFRLLTR